MLTKLKTLFLRKIPAQIFFEPLDFEYLAGFNNLLYRSYHYIHLEMTDFTCEVCGKVFKRRDNYKRHLNIHQQQHNHICNVCHTSFSRLDALKRHIASRHHQEDPISQPTTVDLINSDRLPTPEHSIDENHPSIADTIVAPSQIHSIEESQPTTADTVELQLEIPSTQQLIEAIDVTMFNSPQQPRVRNVDMDLTPSDAPTQYEIHDLSTGELEQMDIECNVPKRVCNNNYHQPKQTVTPLIEDVIDVDELSTPASSPQVISSQTTSILSQNVSSHDSPSFFHDAQLSPGIQQSTSAIQRGSRCKLFPSYCAAGKPHHLCEPVMQRYYKVGSSTYACPTCNIRVNDWLVFMQQHSSHAGEFRIGQKKDLSGCQWFPAYCLSAKNQHGEIQCMTRMREYYDVGLNRFGCPTCNESTATWNEFMQDHAIHAGQFHVGQKQALKPRGCPTFWQCRATSHENADYCSTVTLGYYRVPCGYACPTCDQIILNAEQFIAGHSRHLVEFNRQQFLRRHVSKSF